MFREKYAQESFWTEMGNVAVHWRKLHREELCIFLSLPATVSYLQSFKLNLRHGSFRLEAKRARLFRVRASIRCRRIRNNLLLPLKITIRWMCRAVKHIWRIGERHTKICSKSLEKKQGPGQEWLWHVNLNFEESELGIWTGLYGGSLRLFGLNKRREFFAHLDDNYLGLPYGWKETNYCFSEDTIVHSV